MKKYDKLNIQPLGKEVVVKGIQSQDKDIDQAEHGMRAGINLKGIDAEELKRGYVLCSDCEISKQITTEFTKSKYTKEAVEKGSGILVSVGLQVVAGKVEEAGKELIVSLEQPVAYFKGQKCLVASTKQALPRIIGSGKII